MRILRLNSLSLLASLALVSAVYAPGAGAAPPPFERDWRDEAGAPSRLDDGERIRRPRYDRDWRDNAAPSRVTEDAELPPPRRGQLDWSEPGDDEMNSARGEFERIVTPEYRRRGMRVERMSGGRFRVRLPSEVLFAYNSDNLSRRFAPTLRRVARIMDRRPHLTALIVGHTDDVGSDSFNLDLSTRRAESVAAILTNYGVDSDRLRTEGRGKRDPIGDNASPEGQQMNRRVEIILSRSRGGYGPRGDRPSRWERP